MKRQYVKQMALGLTLLLAVGLFGCGKQTDSLSDTTDSGAAASESAAETTADSEAATADDEGTEASDAENSAADGDSAADAPQNADSADHSESPDAAEPDSSVNSEKSSEPDAPSQSGQAEKDDDSVYEVGSAPTVGIGKVTAKPGQKEVAVDLKFWNNPGYTTCGIQINYDPALQPRMLDDGLVDIVAGDATDGLMALCIAAEDTPILAFGTVGTVNSNNSGTLCTMYFTLPDDAAPGSVYLFSLAIDSMINSSSQGLETETIDGEIRVE